MSNKVAVLYEPATTTSILASLVATASGRVLLGSTSSSPSVTMTTTLDRFLWWWSTIITRAIWEKMEEVKLWKFVVIAFNLRRIVLFSLYNSISGLANLCSLYYTIHILYNDFYNCACRKRISKTKLVIVVVLQCYLFYFWI